MEATDSLNYVYQPLPLPEAIRILLLQPAASFDDALKCDLINSNLTSPQADIAENQSYEAVSYTWGSPQFTHSLACGDNSTNLRITANVDRMLRHLRQPDKARTLWIDATCINQKNVDERNSQIALMGRIFQQASRTIAYIGDSDGASSLLSLWCREQGFNLSDPASWENAFDDLDEDSSVLRPGPQEGGLLRSPSPSHIRLLKSSHAAERLVSRPWFARTWIIQETLLSRNLIIQAGNDMISWLAFAHLIPGKSGVLDVKASFTAKTSKTLSRFPCLRRRQSSFDSLWDSRQDFQLSISNLFSPERLIDYGHLFEMLCETSDYGCADPRDKLFAILSLFQGHTPHNLEPDYSRSLEAVYINISRFLISYGVAKSLSAARGIGGDPSLPTWTIDWRQPRNKVCRGQPGAESGNALDWYCTGDQAQAGFANNRRRMKVIHVGSRGLSLRGICIEREVEPSQLSSESMRSQLLLSEYWERVGWLERISGSSDDQDVNIIRRDEQIGIIPEESKAGDIVCVFLGFRVPFVLRPIAEGWQLIGECYLPWCMEGEMVAHIDWESAFDDQPVAPLEDFHLY